jgi:O-antigen ligase
MLFMTQSVASLLNLNLATLGTLCLFPMRWKLESAIPAIATTIAVGYYSAIAISFNYESILIDLGRDPSLSGRTELWSLILQFVDDRLYFGHGIDAVFGQPAAESLISFIEGWPVPHAHNGWISLLLDYGIVGTALYAVWFGHTLFRAIVHFRNASPTTVWVAGFPIFFLLYILASSASEVSLFSVNRIELVLLLAIALSQPPSGFLAGLLRVPTLTKRFAAKGEI